MPPFSPKSATAWNAISAWLPASCARRWKRYPQAPPPARDMKGGPAMPSISQALRQLLRAEIGNEHGEQTGQSRDGRSSPGGSFPATLGSACDSLVQGYEPLDGFPVDQVQSELNALIQ